MKASTLLLSLPAALQLPTADACSCMPPGDTTGAEIAQSVRNSDSFVFVGRVLNETSYATVEGESIFLGAAADDVFPREYQNITFSLDETLVEGNTGSLPRAMSSWGTTERRRCKRTRKSPAASAHGRCTAITLERSTSCRSALPGN